MHRLRPKSAKQSTKLQFQENSSYDQEEEEEEQPEHHEEPLNKRVISSKERLMSSLYRRIRRPTADQPLMRMLSKNFPQQKQDLYQQTIRLKQQNHKLNQDNTKLKTRIRVLQKENGKLGKAVQMQDDYADTKSRSRLHSNVGINIESTQIPALKRLVREARDQIQKLKDENQKLKKLPKFTKLIQLENQNEILTEEMTKMTALIDQITQEQEEQTDLKKQVKQMDGFLKIKTQQNKELAQQNNQLQEKIYKLEETIRNNLQKGTEREKKFQRDIELNRRKLEEAQKEIGYLRSDLSKHRQQKNQNNTTSSNLKTTNVSRNFRNPIHKSTTNSNFDKESEKKKLQEQLNQLRKKNQELQKKNSDLSSTLKFQQQKLQKTERQKNQKQKYSQKNNKELSQSKGNHSQQKVQINNINSSIDQYNDDFEEQKRKTANDQKYDVLYDQKEDEEEEILYQEEAPKSKPKQKSKPKSAKKGGSKKKNLSDLKSLLTYRMIAQRYQFQQLQQDIKQTGNQTLSIMQISSMLHNSPFFLNPKHRKQVIKMLSPDNHQNQQTQIQTTKLISVLRSLIQDFELKDPQEDDEMYLRVAQMVTVYVSELEMAFEQKKNPQSNTISQKTLRQLFSDLQLQKKYVDLIIAQLSLVSQDLEHLDYVQFLNRFYIDNEDMGVEELDEEYEEDNSKTLNRSKKEQSDDEHASNSEIRPNKSKKK